MVVSRSDTKRRQKDGESGLPESPKRTKVHAQRKFAQGSNLNTPTLTPVKEKDKNKVNGAVVSTELLPAKRPNTEDFLTFLCFRGTQKLPQRLDFFNIATTPEQQDDDSKTDHSVAGSSRVSARCIEKSFSEQSFAVAKAETKARNKPRPTAAVQAFKKKYQEQRLAKQKISLTKLAQKVKGKNMVRTRSAALLEENRRVPKTVPQRSVTVVPAVKAKATPKPVVKQTIKRLNPKQVNSSLRGGLRSGGELPPGSDIGLKSERKPRLVVKDQEPPNPRTQKRFKVKAKKTIASSLSDFSSDDDQPLVKKQRVNLRRQRLQLNTSMSTRSIRLERLRRHRNETSKNSVRSRPTRKTKEAAALFLEEMIGKDLRSPDEDSDYIDETFSDKSFTESPKKTERKEKETKCILEKNKSLSKDNTKKDNDPEIIPTKKKKEEDKKLLKKTVVKLNMIKEKDTKSVKKLSTNKDVENKPTTSKTINEDKVIEQPTRKGELKGKTFVNKADRRHSLPEAPKIMLEKRSTRQRPGNLSLDNSPTRLKTQLNDTDDKFSDSDEEPLGNISSKKSTKQIGAKKGLPEKNVSPVVRKETPKVSGKKNEIKKLKNTEKHGKSEDIKNKPVKKDSVRKSVSEEVVDIEQKFQSVTQNETRSKFRNNKSSKDLDSDVKSLIGNKGNVGTAETKDNILKKTEGNGKSGNAKGNLEKPKLKKGWVICNDIEEPSSNETFSQRKGTKTASNIKESILKKEIDQKASTEEKIIKNDETESVTVAPETPSKKCSKKNKVTSLLPESSVVDKSLQKSNAKSESDLNTSKNKTKQTNKKSNEMIAVENTLLAENVSKNVLKTNTKGNTNSIRNSTEKSSTKIIPENSVIANSPSASVECAKKNIKNKVSISDSEKDTSLQTNKSNKNVDVKVVCESAKSSSISNLKMCTSEIKETTVLDIDGSVSKEISGKDNCIVNKQIEGSVIKTNVNEKVDEDCSDKDISDCKSNKNVMKKTNKANLNKTSNLGSQEIKIQKNKNSSQKVNEKMESTSISTQEENIVKANENTGARCKNKSFEKNKFLVNEHHSENLDAKNKEKTLLATESPQSFITQEAKKTCSEADKNKSIVNTDNSICTETTGGLCTKNVVEENKSSTKQRISDKDINSLKQVDNVSAIKQNTSDQKILNTNTTVDNLINNNNFEAGNLKETKKNVNIFKTQPVQKEQSPGSTKYTPSFMFSKAVEIPNLSNLQKTKSNVEPIDLKSKDQIEKLPVTQPCEQPENSPDASSITVPSYHSHNLNRKSQQRQGVVHKLDLLNPCPKEGIKHNTDIRVSENIDSKDKVLNLDQSRSIKNCQKIDEKMKNEIFFGNTKEVKNVSTSEPKLKVDMPLPGFQLLKSSAKAKSMLKPGTLIDIAGGLNVGLQSDSLTSFMRPPLDNAMTKALKTDSFPPDISSPVVIPKVEVKSEPFSFSTSKSIKDDFVSNSEIMTRKEKVEPPVSSKNKTSVNDTWRQAFKNVKIPKPGTSNNSTNPDKPVVRKPLSVTALAKKHTLAKSDNTSSDKAVSQPSIPFLRQSKLFLGGNQSQTNSPKLPTDTSTSTEIDMNNLRKKEAEVEEIVRRYYAGEFSNSPSGIFTNSVTTECPRSQTEINVSSANNLNISHQKEDYASTHRSVGSVVDVKRTNSPVTIVHVKEDKRGKINTGNEIRTNSPFSMQQVRDGNDILEVNSPVSASIQPKEEISTFSGSIFSGKDRTPSPSSLSKSYMGNVEEHSSRHIPIPNVPVFSKSIHSNLSPNYSEAKHHHLPLPVEQTLKKLSLTKLPTNKKNTSVGNNQSKSQEIKDVTNPVVKSEETIHLPKLGSDSNTKYDDQVTPNFDFNRATTHCLNNEITPLNVDLLAKKKVNKTKEEITKWLSDSTSVGIEHKQNCGIFDRNHCECGYKTVPSTQSSENNQQIQIDDSIKEEVTLMKTIDVDRVSEVLNTDSQSSVSIVTKNEDSTLKSSVKVNEINNKIVLSEIQDALVSVDVIESNNSTHPLNEELVSKADTNINEQLKTTESATNIESLKSCSPLYSEKVKDCENEMIELKPKYKLTKPLKLPETSAKSKKNLENELFESSVDIPTSPIATKPKFGKQSRPGDSEAELSSRDPSEVSSPPPRDDVSSSNDDSPDKFVYPERRSIFHQRRSVMKVKERKEAILSPSTSAFSPDNESSVYAFDPDLPPTSSTPPFRRCRKDGRTSSTATDDDESTPSSASIAVQVNLDNEAVLECSTQTEMQEADDDDGSDGHLFYIPLQQSHADAAKTQQLIQGVAVKLGTEGPDQRVFMRAKLVTKPPSTFSRQPSSSAARALMPTQITRSGKPEQKVRPLSIKSPPVGTVTPTTRAGPSNVQPTVSIQTSPKPDHFEVDEKINVPGPSKETSVEPEVKPNKTKSPDRTVVHAAVKTAKRGKGRQSQVTTASVCTEFPAASDPAKLVEAPTFYPNEKEFQDPLEYIDSIRPLAEKFGLCRVVPPSGFKPECKVSDDMRFTAYNQYIHKMLHRWGPNVKEMMAIRKYLATQSIALTQPPWVGGMEVDLPRLYQTVQICGGLKEVIEKKRWNRVADTMKIPKLAQDRVTKLDDIYCKFLLPYDTLSHEERTKLFKEVESDWAEREKRVSNATDSDSEDSDSDDIDECIVKGRSMALNAFYRIARNTMSMWFSKTEQPSASDVEAEFWRHVNSRQCHVCVHSGSIDSGSVGYGFPVAKNSSTSRHPWNLKVLTNNPGSILRSLGPLMGVTVPTLHVGMLFSACCWYRDPHGLPWIEYLHTGASKIWYGIPDSSSSVFREAATKLVPRLCRDKTIWLASDTAMVPPPLLVERGVSLSRVVQEPGQFIIVFPKAFTSSICTGYVVSESVYFAQPSWLASAQQIFDDIRESCEPCMFSMEKLLFSIATDTRTSVDVLNQILPMMLNIQDEEIARRKQLEELGLSNSERLPVNKRRKNRPTNDEEADYECDICRANLFLSLVTNTHEESVYCLSHAIELLSKKRSQLKHCNFLYTYSENELNDLVDKLKSRIETKSQKKLQGKNVQANKN